MAQSCHNHVTVVSQVVSQSWNSRAAYEDGEGGGARRDKIDERAEVLLGAHDDRGARGEDDEEGAEPDSPQARRRPLIHLGGIRGRGGVEGWGVGWGGLW